MRNIDSNEMKKILLDMLVELDRFCEENDIRYYLAGGTALGAVRHQGFIPWDDDIDVTMPRKDYERFIATYKPADEKKPYSVISMHNNQDYYLQFAKLIAENTVLEEPVDSDLKLGIYLDIFPLDNLGNDYETARKLFRKTNALRQKIMLKNLIWLKQRPLYQNLIIAVGKAFLFENRRSMLEKIDRESRVYESDEMTKYIGAVSTASYGEKEILPSEWYSGYEKLPFEGHAFRVPSGYKEFLTQIYGDYMKLPSEEQQKSRHTYRVWYKD